MPLRIKITNQMIEAAIEELKRHAALDGFVFPTENECPQEWQKMRGALRGVLSAAAAVAVKSPVEKQP